MRFRKQKLHRFKLRDSNWEIGSDLFTDLSVAHYWRISPTDYIESSDEDKVLMTAYYQTINKMNAVESDYNERKSKKKKHGKNRS